MSKHFLVFIICIIVSSNLSAQQTDLDPVTVTASFSPLKTSRTGRNVFVLDGSMISGLPIHSLDELLRYLPGVEVQSRGPLGSQSDIVLRGGTFQQVLIIIDGVRVNDPNTGHFTAYIPIASEEIDRIEILKGASSALYGSDAVGGVINIITKTFAAAKETKSVKANIQAGAGEYQLYTVQAGVFQNRGNTAWSLGTNIISTKGQLQRGIRGFVEAETATASLSHYFKNNWQLALRSSYDKRKFAAQNFYTTFISDTAQETVKTFWNQLQLTHQGTHHTLQLQAGYKNLTDSFAFNPRTPSNQSTSNMWQALVSDNWHLKERTTITFGGQVINKKISSNDRGDHSVNNVAAFVVLNQQLTNRFFIAPAIRLEYNQISKTEFIPQINLSYKTSALQLRGSAGKTVRDADFTERYNNYNKALVRSGSIGNPDLEAERSFSYEAGADYFLKSNLKISGTFFQRFHKKLIDYVNTPYDDMPRKINLIPTGAYALAKNIATVNTSGVECDIQYVKKFEKTKLFATVGLVWLDTESSEASPSFYVSSHAKFLTNFNLVYSFKKIGCSINGLYKTRQPQGTFLPVITKVSYDYLVLNIKADVALWKQVAAFAEVDNITNANYSDLLGALMPGRWLSGGIKISLPK